MLITPWCRSWRRHSVCSPLLPARGWIKCKEEISPGGLAKYVITIKHCDPLGFARPVTLQGKSLANVNAIDTLYYFMNHSNMIWFCFLFYFLVCIGDIILISFNYNILYINSSMRLMYTTRWQQDSTKRDRVPLSKASCCRYWSGPLGAFLQRTHKNEMDARKTLPNILTLQGSQIELGSHDEVSRYLIDTI